MRIYRMSTQTFSSKLLLLLLLAVLDVTNALKCDRTPEGISALRSQADGRFKLRILGEPDRYIPGENYTISLEGILRASHGLTHKFTGFFLTAERDNIDVKAPSKKLDENDSVGRFHIVMGAISKFSDRCANLVTHTSMFAKSDVPVTWTAPKEGTGCITFKATVIENKDQWYSDEGALSKTLCEDQANTGDSQPLILDECKACDEAKYELTFEGLWSRHTHPKDFPSYGWLTKFSDVIGASHTTEYRFWTYGEPASEGLKEVAEHGSTRQLERELKEESEHIRTIIKARGISYPNVTGKTFAVFRVDSKHHLVSLVTMIYPSPDWFVGVSGLELCLSNGSWAEQKILNLYPYDAGTDSGPTYISPDQPTIPKEPIRRIKPNQPNDPRSPFHDPDNNEMKPLARLYLSRQRLYEKNCEAVVSQDAQNYCAVGKWTDWSKCDNPCGKGRRSRQRYYLNPQLAYQKGCKKKLTDHEECHGIRENCDEDFVEDDQMARKSFDPECALTGWASYGECSAACGKGQRSRTRRYRIRKNHKKCQKKDPMELEQFLVCEGRQCEGEAIVVEKPSKKKANRACRLTDWSRWSPCTVTCGLGERMRVRVPIDKHSTADGHQRNILSLYKKFNAKSLRQLNDISEEKEEDEERNETVESQEDDMTDHEILGIRKSDHPCFGEVFVEKQTCGMRLKACEHEIYGIPQFCLLDPKPGACRTQAENRWYYDKQSRECHIFPYTGCHGNKNNFETREQCEQICSRKNSKALVPHSHVNGDRSKAGEKIDCEMTQWKRAPCNVTCGDGYRWKSRAIIKYPQNGGQACPKRLTRLERCYTNCPQAAALTSSQEAPPSSPECSYSDWGPWSPCSKTCGDSAVQIRTRTVQNHLDVSDCNERLEKRQCQIMPCLVDSGYGIYYNAN